VVFEWWSIWSMAQGDIHFLVRGKKRNKITCWNRNRKNKCTVGFLYKYNDGMKRMEEVNKLGGVEPNGFCWKAHSHAMSFPEHFGSIPARPQSWTSSAQTERFSEFLCAPHFFCIFFTMFLNRPMTSFSRVIRFSPR